jgi:hypothetical protein
LLQLLDKPLPEGAGASSVLPLFERARASLDSEGVDPDATGVQPSLFVRFAEAAIERNEADVAEACVQTFLALSPAHDQVSLSPDPPEAPRCCNFADDDRIYCTRLLVNIAKAAIRCDWSAHSSGGCPQGRRKTGQHRCGLFLLFCGFHRMHRPACEIGCVFPFRLAALRLCAAFCPCAFGRGGLPSDCSRCHHGTLGPASNNGRSEELYASA